MPAQLPPDVIEAIAQADRLLADDLIRTDTILEELPVAQTAIAIIGDTLKALSWGGEDGELPTADRRDAIHAIRTVERELRHLERIVTAHEAALQDLRDEALPEQPAAPAGAVLLESRYSLVTTAEGVWQLLELHHRPGGDTDLIALSLGPRSSIYHGFRHSPDSGWRQLDGGWQSCRGARTGVEQAAGGRPVVDEPLLALLNNALAGGR
jgi:hypothetical protein